MTGSKTRTHSVLGRAFLKMNLSPLVLLFFAAHPEIPPSPPELNTAKNGVIKTRPSQALTCKTGEGTTLLRYFVRQHQVFGRLVTLQRPSDKIFRTKPSLRRPSPGLLHGNRKENLRARGVYIYLCSIRKNQWSKPGDKIQSGVSTDGQKIHASELFENCSNNKSTNPASHSMVERTMAYLVPHRHNAWHGHAL